MGMEIKIKSLRLKITMKTVKILMKSQIKNKKI